VNPHPPPGQSLHRYVARSHHNEAEKQDKKSIAMNPLARSTSYHSALSDEGVPTKTDVALAEVPMTRWGKFIHFLKTHPDVDVHSTGKEVAVVAEIHENAEEFDETAEAVFRYIQVFTAVCDSFAHGANDVANAMGPFMSIYIIYHNGEVSKKSDTSNDSYWILALGGIGMGVGLFIYGYKIIRAIGIKLAKVTPSRGFAIELGAAIVIIIGSYLGIPLSTTHCQVGATVGVGLLEGKGGVNKRTLGITVLGWVLTLLVAGLGAAMLTAQGVYAPSIERLHQCPAV
jgi:sodium-dependent phosphate transporter